MEDYPTAALHCIDLSNPDIYHSAALLKKVNQKPHSFGMLRFRIFYVTNHGISEEFMNDAFAQSKKFFGLPQSEKEILVKEGKNRGYKNFLNQKEPNYSEIYRMGVDLPEDDPNANIWPSAVILPRWKETMLSYYKETLNVARRVARIIAIALDVSFDFFDQPKLFGETMSNLFLLHYGGQIIDPSKELIIGARDHTDFGLITLLATNNVLGLQICKDKYAKPQLWEYVRPLKGAFIVNLGDILERFSNDVFRSTVHRVIFRGEDRYSMAFFLYPSLDCVIECLPGFVSEQNPPKYPPITCGEFLSASYDKIQLKF